MLPTRHLPGLAAAERALGRLDAALADTAVRSRHAPGALRRTVLASLRLDGEVITEDDLMLMAVVTNTVAPGARAAAQRAVDLLCVADKLNAGRLRTGPATLPFPAARQPASGFATAGLQAALEGLAWLEGTNDEDTQPEPDDPKERPPSLPPWSPAWAIAAFQDWLAAEGLPTALHPDAADAVADGIRAVERVLAGEPGLVGAGRALLHLHHRDDPPVRRRGALDPFENPVVRRLRERPPAAPRFWSILARLAAPVLLRRGCGLEHAHLPLAVALADSAGVFRTLLAAPEDDAVGWLLDRIAGQGTAELARIAAVERHDADRHAALAGHRRDAGARALLGHLWSEPVLTIRRAAALLGSTERAARTAIGTLVDAGILRGVAAWSDDAPPLRAAGRPLVYAATECGPPSSRPAPPRRRRSSEPPAGTPMLWQPIATAPHDGKRCLVWVGRPALAVYDRSIREGAPAWREGRRVLRPTHWLPLAPPEPAPGSDG